MIGKKLGRGLGLRVHKPERESRDLGRAGWLERGVGLPREALLEMRPRGT